MTSYIYPKFGYRRSQEQAEGVVKRHPIVVVGAGPIGLTAALDCAARGQPVVVLDDNDTVSIGSRRMSRIASSRGWRPPSRCNRACGTSGTIMCCSRETK